MEDLAPAPVNPTPPPPTFVTSVRPLVSDEEPDDGVVLPTLHILRVDPPGAAIDALLATGLGWYPLREANGTADTDEVDGAANEKRLPPTWLLLAEETVWMTGVGRTKPRGADTLPALDALAPRWIGGTLAPRSPPLFTTRVVLMTGAWGVPPASSDSLRKKRYVESLAISKSQQQTTVKTTM